MSPCLLCVVVNDLYPTWPLSVHSLTEEVLSVCSEPQTVLGFRGGKGESDPVNVTRISCISFLFGNKIPDEIKRRGVSKSLLLG